VVPNVHEKTVATESAPQVGVDMPGGLLGVDASIADEFLVQSVALAMARSSLLHGQETGSSYFPPNKQEQQIPRKSSGAVLTSMVTHRLQRVTNDNMCHEASSVVIVSAKVRLRNEVLDFFPQCTSPVDFDDEIALRDDAIRYTNDCMFFHGRGRE
jgi:hypothetical protein